MSLICLGYWNDAICSEHWEFNYSCNSWQHLWQRVQKRRSIHRISSSQSWYCVKFTLWKIRDFHFVQIFKKICINIKKFCMVTLPELLCKQKELANLLRCILTESPDAQGKAGEHGRCTGTSFVIIVLDWMTCLLVTGSQCVNSYAVVIFFVCQFLAFVSFELKCYMVVSGKVLPRLLFGSTKSAFPEYHLCGFRWVWLWWQWQWWKT